MSTTIKPSETVFDLSKFQADEKLKGRPVDPSLAECVPLGISILSGRRLTESAWDRNRSGQTLIQYFSSTEHGLKDSLTTTLGWDNAASALTSWALSIKLLERRYTNRVLVTDNFGASLALKLRLPYTEILTKLTPLEGVGRCPIGVGKLVALASVTDRYPKAILVDPDVQVFGALPENGDFGFLSLDSANSSDAFSWRSQSIRHALATISSEFKNSLKAYSSWAEFCRHLFASGYLDFGVFRLPASRDFASTWQYWIARNAKLMELQEAGIHVSGVIEQTLVPIAYTLMRKPLIPFLTEDAFCSAGVVRWTPVSKKNSRATASLVTFVEYRYPELSQLIRRALR